MSSFQSLAHNHTDLDPEDLDHVSRLMSTWGMLSDLCFADLLLFAPVTGSEGSRFVVLGQARPTTSQTFHLDVLFGRVVDEFERPIVARSWRRQEMLESDDQMLGRGERARVQCIPVVRAGRIIAILSRESPLMVGRRPGQLEHIYIDTFQRLARMISRGEFPYMQAIGDKSSPRIGDGSLLLDAERRIRFASPNAMNAIHRMGFHTQVLGASMEELGVADEIIEDSYNNASPITEELEPRLNVSLSLICVPLMTNGDVDGALVMIRDVTDLRRLDRLLMSKDATIREIHHRVKNNLQTISSLLDLQARRIPKGPARNALDEAHRRVRSIALVHEILSRDASEQVAFNEIIEPLIKVAAESYHHEQDIDFQVFGDAGELDADVATPLAVIVAEILANAVEHAFNELQPEFDPQRRVVVTMANDGDTLNVAIRDNGSGLPPGFSIKRTRSLGLTITRSLVESQLLGEIQMKTAENPKGTMVELSVPLRAHA